MLTDPIQRPEYVTDDVMNLLDEVRDVMAQEDKVVKELGIVFDDPATTALLMQYPFSNDQCRIIVRYWKQERGV